MIYEYRSRIRFSEVDEFGTLTMYALLNYLQDTATFHGEDAGIGIARNKEAGQAWVIADMQLSVHRYPLFNERIVVKTWPEKFRGMIGRRCFQIETEAGEVCARAYSNWVYMDMIKGEPMKVPDEQAAAFGEYPELAFEEDLGKRKIRMPGEGETFDPILIRDDHLDTNHHMNNAQYVRLANKFLPQDFAIRRMRVEWKKQALLGCRMTPEVVEADGSYYVRFLADDNDVYFICEFTG